MILSKQLFKMLGLKGLTLLCLAVSSVLVIFVCEYVVALSLAEILPKVGILQYAKSKFMLGEFIGQQSLNVYIGVFVVLLFSRFVFQFFSRLLFKLLELLYAKRAREKILSTYLFKGKDEDVSSINYKTGFLVERSKHFVTTIAQLISYVSFVVLSLSVLFYLLPLVTAVVLVGVVLFAPIYAYCNKKASYMLDTVREPTKKLFSIIHKISASRLLVSVYGTAEYEMSKIKKFNFNIIKNSAIGFFVNFLVISLTPLIGGMFFVSLVLLYHKGYFEATPQIILVYTAVLTRFVQKLNAVSEAVAGGAAMFPFYKEIMLYFDEYDFDDTNNLEVKNEISTSKRLDSIELDNLKYRFSNGHYINYPVSLVLKKGDIFVIKGESGSGKSTFINMLLGQLEPKNGSIHYNDIKAVDYIKNSSEKVAYSGASPLLSKGTIRENILYGLKSLKTDEEILKLLKKVNLNKYATVQGLQVEISEDLEGLSVGEKQRISLVRSLLRDPEILVLDEVTANLDAFNTKSIVDIVDSGRSNLITVIATHSKVFDAIATKTMDLDLSNEISLKASNQ